MGVPLTILAVWACSLFVAELTFRLLGDHPSADLGGLYRAFGDKSYRLAPGVRTGADWASGPFDVVTDSLGLRCDASGRFATKAGTTLDFLFVGDSQGFGNGVDFEKTIPGVVAEEAATIGLRSANASVGGHGPFNQVELVRELQDKEGLQVRHYVVLLTSGMAMYGSGYNRASVGADGRLYAPETAPLQQLLIFLKQSSVAYSRLRNAVRNLGLGATPSADAPFILQVYATNGKEAEARANLKLFLTSLSELGVKNGATVAVVYVPLTVEVEFAGVEAAAGERGMVADRELPRTIVREVTSELGLPLIDLRPVLEAEAAAAKSLHLAGDYHYSDTLSRAAGVEVWRKLRNQYLKH